MAADLRPDRTKGFVGTGHNRALPGIHDFFYLTEVTQSAREITIVTIDSQPVAYAAILWLSAKSLRANLIGKTYERPHLPLNFPRSLTH